MATPEKKRRCRHCRSTSCRVHCPKTNDGVHAIDASAVNLDIESLTPELVLEVTCERCEQCGVAFVNGHSIAWNG